MKQPVTPFTVVGPDEYIAALQKIIPKAKHRIVVAAMLVRSDVIAGEILRQIIAAAKRGVDVHVLSDIYAQSGFSRPPTVSAGSFKRQCQETRDLFAELTAAGGKTTWVGKVGVNPYRGRYHIKVTIVDDDVFSFGGINFSDSEFTATDYMLHATDTALADNLQRLIADNAVNLPASDHEWQIGDDTSVLYDAGKPGVSLIYKRACELAKHAAKIVYVSQMAPSGELAKLLRGAQTTYYASRPSQSGIHPNALAQWWDQRRVGLPNAYEGKGYVHAKMILFELKNGEKAVLSGSHNFSWRGVTFGTKEIALCSNSVSLWKRLHEVVYKVATAD